MHAVRVTRATRLIRKLTLKPKLTSVLRAAVRPIRLTCGALVGAGSRGACLVLSRVCCAMLLIEARRFLIPLDRGPVTQRVLIPRYSQGALLGCQK